jgi:hypothetical protein
MTEYERDWLQSIWIPEIVVPYTIEVIDERCREYIRNVRVERWSILTALKCWSQLYRSTEVELEFPLRFFLPYFRADDPIKMCCEHIGWRFMDRLRDLSPKLVSVDTTPAPRTRCEWNGDLLTFRLRFAYR